MWEQLKRIWILINLETDYVTGTSAGSGSSGNPSPVTAYGIYHGMKAAAKEAFGTIR